MDTSKPAVTEIATRGSSTGSRPKRQQRTVEEKRRGNRRGKGIVAGNRMRRQNQLPGANVPADSGIAQQPHR
jgi:hypothetical protein